jgi:alkanesulfonate monooxygenase SsuD/methylene tetrahydromethanopterin reductase-like flavin-dependent oxidoreductase (luciferase family)
MLPQTEGMRGPGVRGWSEVKDMAQAAEDVGFDSLWLVDHFLYLLDGEAQARGVWEGWSLLSALAAVTTRAELGTLVLGTGFRNPALLAKMTDTVEEISGGRLILGLGAGYHPREYDAFGYPHNYRYSRFAEAIQIVHGLLRDGQVDFEGKFYSARECELKPRGPRASGPPILIGSIGPRMLKLVAKYADQWNAYYDDTGNSVEGAVRLRGVVDARPPSSAPLPCSWRIRMPTPGGPACRVTRTTRHWCRWPARRSCSPRSSPPTGAKAWATSRSASSRRPPKPSRR